MAKLLPSSNSSQSFMVKLPAIVDMTLMWRFAWAYEACLGEKLDARTLVQNQRILCQCVENVLRLPCSQGAEELMMLLEQLEITTSNVTKTSNTITASSRCSNTVVFDLQP